MELITSQSRGINPTTFQEEGLDRITDTDPDGAVVYLVLVQEAAVHDVVEVREEVCVGGHVLAPLHDPADQLVGVELPLLVALRQHGRLEATHTHAPQEHHIQYRGTFLFYLRVIYSGSLIEVRHLVCKMFQIIQKVSDQRVPLVFRNGRRGEGTVAQASPYAHLM